MDTTKAAKEIAHLTEQINHYNKAFFQEHRSLISDYEFDQLLAKLIRLEKKFPSLKKKNSPTLRIGEKTNKGFVSRKHLNPMLSLSNTYDVAQVEQFAQRIQKLLPKEKITYFCELKYDGTAVSIHYKKGKLQYILTRGNGVEGDDVTANGRTITTIPTTLPAIAHLPHVEVRGEVFMTKKAFDTLNKKQAEANKPLLANPRNTAAGTLKTLDTTIVANRNLSFCPYTLIGKSLDCTTQEAAIKKLEQLGFHVSKTYRMCHTLEEVLEYIHYWEKIRVTLPMEIDGIVIKVNALDQQKKLGFTSKSPRGIIAYKYKPQSASTQLEKIIYQVGRTGVITPVAQLSPILLAGSTIQRATLHNSQEMQSLGLRTYDSVFLEKGGDVIPKITAVDLAKRKKESTPIHFITQCPCCDTTLVKEEEGAHHYCPNTTHCTDQLKGKLRHFVHRNAMHITHIGEKTIETLFTKKIIQYAADLYTLTRSSFIGLPGFKSKTVDNILTSITDSKKQPFDKVLFALGIRHVGATLAYKLATHFKNIEHLATASEESLIALPEVGPQIAKSLCAFFENNDERTHLHNLQKAGLQFILKEEAIQTHQPLKGLSFVITGTFDGYSREQMRTHIQKHGGKVVTAPSAQVNYLVKGHSAGPKKITQADKLNIKIIDEERLEKLIQ